MKYKSNQNKYAYFTFVNRDKEIADKVITYLEENKCRLVYKENTNFSEDLTPDVLEQVKNASQLVVLISDTSVNSRLIKKEIDYALLRGIRVLCIYAKKFIEMIPTLEKKIASLESVLFLENDIDNFYDLLFKSMDPYVFDRAEQFEEYENQYTFFSKYKNYEFPSQTFLKPYVISQEFEDNLYDVSVARKKKINALFKEANFPAQVGTFFFYDSYTKFNLVFTQKITMSQA
ncbi:MAG: toll/interleukin-1 receptor domain-containing protein, partial [Bacilli bacterium]|nr:toll/interleukin-1 receptor domain-containing protein [Bacilli bacterium]